MRLESGELHDLRRRISEPGCAALRRQARCDGAIFRPKPLTSLSYKKYQSNTGVVASTTRLLILVIFSEGVAGYIGIRGKYNR
jgi:hypothetical protein